MRKNPLVVVALMLAPLLVASVASAYTVRRGDSLWKIATRSGTTGQSLAVPTSTTPKVAAAPQVIDWIGPTGGKYPSVLRGDALWLDVSLSVQRVYVRRGNNTIYAMVTSGGLDPNQSTPRGTFYVEPERGEWFYAPRFQEGAKYWVSFKGHGVYLFHSVVMDEKQQVIASEARKLGQPASHGCLRLSVSDAKWIYDHIPTYTMVMIHD